MGQGVCEVGAEQQGRETTVLGGLMTVREQRRLFQGVGGTFQR